MQPDTLHVLALHMLATYTSAADRKQGQADRLLCRRVCQQGSYPGVVLAAHQITIGASRGRVTDVAHNALHQLVPHSVV